MNYQKVKWLLFVIALVAAVFIFWPHHKKTNSSQSPPKKRTAAKVSKNAVTPIYPLDKADSLWVIVNKGRILPSTYVPAGLRAPQIPLRLSASNPEMTLRPETDAALEELAGAAKTEGLNLMLASGYRSYSLQVTVHDSEVRNNGATANIRRGWRLISNRLVVSASSRPVLRIRRRENGWRLMPTNMASSSGIRTTLRPKPAIATNPGTSDISANNWRPPFILKM
jgi:hypothetical protein